MVYGGGVKKSILTWLLCIKFDEIYARYTDAQYSLFRKWMYLAESAHVQGSKYTQKNHNTLWSKIILIR